tara:strand:+ start:6411 stop:7427 length:1017 start_codon:yes stop_codon:yes gene_type:complete
MQNNYNIIPKSNNYVLQKEFISIDSNDRDIRKWKNSNHFEINLPNYIQNVNYIKLTNISLPMNLYNISSQFQNTKFKFTYSSTEYEVELADGFYSATDLAKSITNSMNIAVGNTNFVVVYNKLNNKFSFGSTASAFTLTFNYQPTYDNCSTILYNNYSKWGLGFILGFEKKQYNSTSTATPLKFINKDTQWLASGHYLDSPNQFNILQYNSIYLELDRHNYISEIQPYSENTNSTYNNDLAFKVNSVFAKIPIPLESSPTMVRDENNNYTIVNLNSSKFICNSKNYFPPIKSMNKLKFKFRYHDGLLVDFNTLPVSFIIEIGTLQEEQRRLANIRFQN